MRRRPALGTIDRIVAAVLFVWVQVQAFWFTDSLRKLLVTAVVGGVATASVAVRRRYPGTVGIGVQTLMVAGVTVSHPPAGAITIGWFCALYALAVWTSLQLFCIGVVYFVGTSIGPDLVEHADMSTVGPFAVGGAVVMVLVRLVVTQRDRRLSLAAREQDLAMREAIGLERARIARELHDVIAHHVSMMVVQAGAERRVLDGGDSSTREVLATIERSGRSALTDMRRLVGMLRGGEHDSLAPQPGLADVPMLVHQAREAGLPIDLTIEGERGEIPDGVDLCAYRIVQEGLTNAMRHAGRARTSVLIRYRPGVICIDIVDDGRDGSDDRAVPGGGLGLVGIRERVALYGGTLQTGPRPDGGFSVGVTLPVPR